MTRKQIIFIAEYLVDSNASRAALAAGYSERTAGSIGHELLKKPDIQAEITKRMEERRRASLLTVDRLMDELDQIKKRCMQGEPVLDSEGNPTGEWKFDSRGALRAVELQGKHLGMFAEVDSKKKPGDTADSPPPKSLGEASALELVERLIEKGEKNAIQKPRPTGVLICEQTEDSQEILGGDTQNRVPEFTGLQRIT